MAIIDYTRRKERLGNLGPVRSVDRPDVSGLQANVAVARSQERLWEAGDRLGRSLAGLGERIGRGAIGLSAQLRQREDDRLLAKAAGMIIGINEKDLLSTDRDESGMPAGFLNRTGEDCKDLTVTAQTKLKKTLDAVGEELELSDDQMETLRLKMSPYARSCESRLMRHETDETLRIQVAEAEALWKNELGAIAAGNNTDEMYEATLADFAHWQDVKGTTGEPRALERATFLRSMLKGDVEGVIRGFRTEEQFDAAIAAAEKDPAALFMGNAVLKREMGGTVGKDLRDELVKELRDERDRFVGRERHERMLEAEKVKEGLVREELDLAGKNLPPTEMVAFYRACGNDPQLQAASPETALQYMQHAERLEKAIKQGESDQTEDSLSLRLTNLMVREANGDQGLQGGKIAAEQAAIWRDYQAALHAGKLSEGFAGSFLNRLTNRLSDQERNAMREFYFSFGWHGDLNGEGEPSAKDRKDWAKEKVLAPVDETQPLTGDVAKGRKLTGAQMFELGDMFLRQLKTMGPEAYRPEVMKTIIGEIKAQRMASDFNRNRDLLAQKLYNIQRNLSAGIGDQGTGNREDDNGESDDE